MSKINQKLSVSSSKRGVNASKTDETNNMNSNNSVPQLSGDKIDSLDWNDLCVEMRQLFFKYDTNKNTDHLLKNVNMTIPKSAIYGLLGPSGCGKTTLIKLIMGRLKPSSGTVKVYGREPRHPLNKMPGSGVGFMPQELALYGEFTISETLYYFARIYGLESEHKKTRIEFLIKFLDLPDPQRSVGVLSGGQQRRVSLAVAIIHNPPFLILDEPTVGVDPLLRERIWQHLVDMSNNESTTILVTTHYIEEARRAHVISLARSGTLLVEHSPEFLLKHFKVNNLEDVFLKVCMFETNKSDFVMPKNYTETQNSNEPKIPKVRKSVSKQEVNSTHSNRILASLHKNFIRTVRNKMLFFIQTLLPSLCMALYCVCIGNPPYDLDVAVYNPEYDSLPPNNQSVMKENLLSLKFLENIDSYTINKIKYGSNESAVESVKTGDTKGALIFDKEFTSSVITRAMESLGASNETVDKSTIRFFADLTDLFLSQTLMQKLFETSIKFMVQLMIGSNLTEFNPKSVQPMVHLIPIYGSLNPKFRDFMAPGLVICVVFVLAIGLTALSFVTERKEGLLERTLVAGVKLYEILISQIAVQLIVLLIQALLLIITLFPIFRVENHGSYPLLIVIVILQGVCGMTYGLMVSAVSKDEQAAMVITAGSLLPYLIISGIIWPLEGMDKWLRRFSLILPQTLPVISLRNIMLKGWGLSHFYVWIGFVSSLVWIIIFIIATIFLNSLRKD